MTAYVHTFDSPGNAYRRPAMLCAHCIQQTLDTREWCLREWLATGELERLIAEQRAEMAGQNEAGDGVEPIASESRNGGGTP